MIVVLAIIALIAVPMILNIVEKARQGAAISSARSYIKAVETYVVSSELDKNKLKLDKNNKYNVTKDTIIESKNYLKTNDLVSLKGSFPTGSDDYIILGETKQVIEALLTINGYEILIKDDEVISIVKGKKIEVESISLNKTKETMERGSTFTLVAIFKPENASDQRVKYTSSDEDIVTVTEEGVVTAKNIGTAKVIVTSVDDTSKKSECEITVIASATGLKIEPTETEIKIGEKVTLIGTIEPSDATTSSLTWTTSDINIASVDENGVVTGISRGEATITATTVNGISSTSKITVNEIYAESISLNQTNVTLENGQTLQLIATVLPNDTTNKAVTWTSSNNGIATVDGNGLVTGRGSGSTTITATTSNGKIATCNITVIISPSGISINPTWGSVEVNSTLQLIATVLPNDTTNKAVTWTSSNTSVATVDGNGLVTGRGIGTVTITATTVNGKSASANINVTAQSYLLTTQVQVGDYVAYDAGTWTSTVALPTSKGQFGGYTADQNKANSVRKCGNTTYGATTLKGWRVLKIENNQVYLVHAGQSECYYHRSEPDSSIIALNNRATSEYLNPTYAESAHNITYDEALNITGSLTGNTNTLRRTGDYYWLAKKNASYNLYSVSYEGAIGSAEVGCFGVRPVIVLKQGVRTTGKTTDAVGQEAWNLIAP